MPLGFGRFASAVTPSYTWLNLAGDCSLQKRHLMIKFNAKSE